MSRYEPDLAAVESFHGQGSAAMKSVVIKPRYFVPKSSGRNIKFPPNYAPARRRLAKVKKTYSLGSGEYDAMSTSSEIQLRVTRDGRGIDLIAAYYERGVGVRHIVKAVTYRWLQGFIVGAAR